MTAPEVCRGRVSFLYLTGWRDRECGKVGCVEHGFNKSKVQSPTTQPPSSESGMEP